jgi:hypothetical protein
MYDMERKRQRKLISILLPLLKNPPLIESKHKSQIGSPGKYKTRVCCCGYLCSLWH